MTTKPNPFRQIWTKQPIADNNKRVFELRITDMTTKMAYFYSVETTHGELMSDPPKVRSAIAEGFLKLLATVFKPTLPPVTTQVID